MKVQFVFFWVASWVTIHAANGGEKPPLDVLVRAVLDKEEAQTIEIATAGMVVFEYAIIESAIVEIANLDVDVQFECCVEVLSLCNDAKPWVRRRAYHAVACFCLHNNKQSGLQFAFLQGVTHGISEKDAEAKRELTILKNRLGRESGIDTSALETARQDMGSQ